VVTVLDGLLIIALGFLPYDNSYVILLDAFVWVPYALHFNFGIYYLKGLWQLYSWD